MGRKAEARVAGVLRGGYVVGDTFRFHAPYPVEVTVSAVSELRFLE